MSIVKRDMIAIGTSVAIAIVVFSDLKTGPEYSGANCQLNVESAARHVVERTNQAPIKDMVVKAATLCDAGKSDEANRVLDEVERALRRAQGIPG